MVDTKQGLPIMSFGSVRKFETWLGSQHRASSGIWLKIAKKDSGIASITYAQALEIALCHGWIDGQKAPFDGTWWLQKFTPRGPRSKWSKINRARALELIGPGRMRPAGRAAVEEAQRTGRWERAYDSQRTATVPDDLQRELDRAPEAAAFFKTLNSINRYAILYRLQAVKTPQARARRIRQFVDMLGRHEKIHP